MDLLGIPVFAVLDIMTYLGQWPNAGQVSASATAEDVLPSHPGKSRPRATCNFLVKSPKFLE